MRNDRSRKEGVAWPFFNCPDQACESCRCRWGGAVGYVVAEILGTYALIVAGTLLAGERALLLLLFVFFVSVPCTVLINDVLVARLAMARALKEGEPDAWRHHNRHFALLRGLILFIVLLCGWILPLLPFMWLLR